MQKWEYLDVLVEGNYIFEQRVHRVNGKVQEKPKPDFREYMRSLGQEGWEMFSIRGDASYFKRPIEE